MPRLIIFLFCILSVSISAAQPVIQRDPTTRFAVIGDYGDNSSREAEVAALVHRLQPDFVITTGDNNYPAGQAETIDANIGQHYSSFIGLYRGAYGQGASGENRFFPSLGNHDWETGTAQPYTDYFALPGNERYYDFPWGAAHFFALDVDPHEPDGHDRNSLQAQWLRERLAIASEPWRIVYMHQPPFSSSTGYSTASSDWPFIEWGASAVFAGHAHNYERLDFGGVPYVVNGLGGANPNNFGDAHANSQFRFNAAHGAMLVEITESSMTMNFYGIYGKPLAYVNASPALGEWLELDITHAVQADGVYNFMLDSTVRNIVAFSPIEAGENPPELLVDGVSFIATEDATVDSFQPDRRLGENRGLQLIRTNTVYRRVYLQFQLSGISSPPEQVLLRLYVQRLEPDAQGGISLYLVDSSQTWTDDRIRWNNAPAIIMDDSPIDSFTVQR